MYIKLLNLVTNFVSNLLLYRNETRIQQYADDTVISYVTEVSPSWSLIVWRWVSFHQYMSSTISLGWACCSLKLWAILLLLQLLVSVSAMTFIQIIQTMWSVMLWAQNADMENRWDSTKGERIIEAVAKLRKKEGSKTTSKYQYLENWHKRTCVSRLQPWNG